MLISNQENFVLFLKCDIVLHMGKVLNIFIDLLKWPLAAYMLFSIPAFLMSANWFNFFTIKYIVFFGGVIFFAFTLTVSDKSIRTSMQTLAHEFTHTFFALVTFHKIDHIRLNPDETGGSMGFQGKGNWLITISPYFFPLFAFIFMIVFSFFIDNEKIGLFLNVILGYLLAYHLDTVTSQIHEKQTDLPAVGYHFCWMFLPGANLCMIGSILAFNSKGWHGLFRYNQEIYNQNITNLSFLLNLF